MQTKYSCPTSLFILLKYCIHIIYNCAEYITVFKHFYKINSSRRKFIMIFETRSNNAISKLSLNAHVYCMGHPVHLPGSNIFQKKNVIVECWSFTYVLNLFLFISIHFYLFLLISIHLYYLYILLFLPVCLFVSKKIQISSFLFMLLVSIHFKHILCLTVCLYQINVKTVKSRGPNFV